MCITLYIYQIGKKKKKIRQVTETTEYISESMKGTNTNALVILLEETFLSVLQPFLVKKMEERLHKYLLQQRSRSY